MGAATVSVVLSGAITATIALGFITAHPPGPAFGRTTLQVAQAPAQGAVKGAAASTAGRP